MKKAIIGAVALSLVAGMVASHGAQAGNKKPEVARNGGREGGNGGGGLMINGVYRTFGELGVSVNDPKPTGYVIPADVQKELLKLLDSKRTHLNREKWTLLWNLAAGPGVQFRTATVIDPAKFEAIRRDYVKAIKDAGDVLAQGEFKLFAVTGQEDRGEMITTLFPDFFKLQSENVHGAHGAALILFHEGIFRGTHNHASLPSVLKAEAALEALQHVKPINADPTDLYMALKESTLFSLDDEIGHFLKYLKESRGYLMTVGDFAGVLYKVSENREERSGYASETLLANQAKLFELDLIHPKFSRIFRSVGMHSSNSVSESSIAQASFLFNDYSFAPENLAVQYSDDALKLVRSTLGYAGYTGRLEDQSKCAWHRMRSEECYLLEFPISLIEVKSIADLEQEFEGNKVMIP
jgi:hypothetical protein